VYATNDEEVRPLSCEAVDDRQKLTDGMRDLLGPNPAPSQGTERELIHAFRVLQGVVAEMTNGGDQMAELCTCGEHIDRDDGLKTFTEVQQKYFSK
jgi:hypothetical protein